MNIEDMDDAGLLADLDAALDASKPVVEAPEGETAEQQEAREYIREGRRFVPKPKEEVKAEEAPVEGEKPAEAAPAKPAWKPPWYKDEYGPWDKLGEPFRNALREQDRAAQTEIQRRGESLKAWEPVSQAIQPYQQELQAAGVSPQQFVGNLVSAHEYLRSKPVEALQWLAREYTGVDLMGLADYISQNGGALPAPDPRDQTIAQMQNQLKQLMERPNVERAQATRNEVEAWSQDKADFEAVRPLMAAFANQNPKATLDQLYEQARWAHPETRERILKEQEDKRIAELRGKKAAGAQSPRGQHANGAAPSYKTMSLEDEIAMHLDGGV